MKVFVARQPIFNEKEDIFAYELLYRSNTENQFPNIDGDQATADVIINSFINIGIQELSNGKPCFINFTENLLQLRLPTYFQPMEIVVEILESVTPSIEVIEICKELKELGYQIALDDFVFDEENPHFYEYVKYADIIKVDFLCSTEESRAKIEKMAKTLKLKLLAEKVETRKEFEQAKARGYDYFQGYFFSKPTIVSNYDIPSHFHSHLEIINNLSRVEPEVDVIARLIERDLSLSYKLLKLINTLAFRRRNKIHSISQAVVLLGFIELEKWLYVLAVRDSTNQKSELSNEIVRTCLTRAKTCEAIEKLRNHYTPTTGYFMMGMFSLMDSLLGVPMDKLLKKLPLSDDICNALNGEDNDYKQVLDLVIDVEKGNWGAVAEKCKYYQIDENELFTCYKESLNWSNEIIVLEKS
ncbi:MAG TPA: EAL domain-containing protein [Bacillus bacterium]|nr:EAL domain-containing protein [Bacillus sp. (in: firmicutes)]